MHNLKFVPYEYTHWYQCLMSFKAFLIASPGRLGLLDYDEVELSNLHRQVLHGEENQGQAKALSAASAVQRYRAGSVLLLQPSVCM